MSFAVDVKNELARIEPDKKCCMLAEIAGFLRVAGAIRLAGGGKFKIVITTENPAIVRHFKKLIQDYFGIETTFDVGESDSLRKTKAYNINIDSDNRSEQILRETGILLVREGNNYISDGIYESLIRSKCCKRAYLRGMFMGAGTMSNPEKSYHLEFVCRTETLASDLKKIINSFSNIEAKFYKRGKSFVVYMKKADYIADMLGIMGADSHSLKVETTWVDKSMRNKVNRMANCDNANVDKIVEAAMKQIEAINKIEQEKGLNWLPEKLREVAELRRKNPDVSLTALGEMCNPKLKKSGINGRLKNIVEIASKL